MSYIKITVHAVWSTKRREPLLIQDKRNLLFHHIKENARTKGIYIDTINGYLDHVHCLISLGSEQTIAKVIQLIKGESSFWANKENLFDYKLQWSDDYFVASVSESSLNKVRDYIKNQEEHHKKVSFKEEYEKFLSSFGIQYN